MPLSTHPSWSSTGIVAGPQQRVDQRWIAALTSVCTTGQGLTPTTESPMAKATARLSPRQVLGNRKSPLSIGEAAAALVAMLAGAGRITPPTSSSSLQQTEAANV